MNRATKFSLTILCAVLLQFAPELLFSQEMPPRPVSASLIRNLSFGAFTVGYGGGSVTQYANGARIASGDIILFTMGYLYYPAIFQLEGNPGTIVHFLAGTSTSLAGNNGGNMMMTLADVEPGTPFILPWSGNGTMDITVGGILTVGSPVANPAGDYIGNFVVMFIQE